MAIEATTLALAQACARKLVDEYMQAHPPVPGADGKSAYDLAVTNGYVGSEAAWLESLHGADGYTPVKGVDYFTDDDKTELVDAVLAALPAAEGG